MRKSIPILILTSVLATATFFSCKRNDITDPNISTGVSEVLEMPGVPYKYDDGTTFGLVSNLDQKAALGRVLFYDRHLSINNSVSCATCHKQAFAFSDNVAGSRGFENRVTSRNSMALLNLPGPNVFGGTPITLFWDGRSSSLKDLIMRPIGNHVEMGIKDVETLPGKLQELSYYSSLFQDAYGDDKITNDRISESMTIFIQAIKADNSKLDRQQQGEKVMNAQELYGMTLFDSKYNCRSCHTLSTVSVYYGNTGSNFINIGLNDLNAGDIGRGVITGNAADNGKFRVPNLHNVGLTAPYMHDGRFNTLEDVIDHYSHNIKDNANLDVRLKGTDGKAMQMNIGDQDKAALVAFLNTLTDAEVLVDPRFSNPFKIK